MPSPEIRAFWPSVVHRTGQRSGIPGDATRQPRLRIIGWEDFFAHLKAHDLSFVYEILPDGRPGRRFELLQIQADHNAPTWHDSDTAVQQ